MESCDALGSKSPKAQAIKLFGREGSGMRGAEQQCGSVSSRLKVKKPLVETRPDENDWPLNGKLKPKFTSSVAALLCEMARTVGLERGMSLRGIS